MADPTLSAASSLSEEDTARTLGASPHPEPLQSRQQQQPCTEMPQLNVLSPFGYPMNGTFPINPQSAQNDEAVSMLVGMDSPSMSRNDWCQHPIQEQFEHQQECQGPLNQQRQQEIQEQLQHMEMQMWQQEQVQGQQMQAERLMETTLQPRYSARLDPIAWSDEGHSLRAYIPSFDSGGSQGTVGQLDNAQAGCSELLPVTTMIVPLPTQPESMDRNDGVFAEQQNPQIVQAHLQARNPQNLAIKAVHWWRRHGVMLIAGIPPERTNVSRMRTMQQYIQLQSLQPQPYYLAEINQRCHQVIGTIGQASGSGFDDAFLHGIMEHFSTNRTPVAGNPDAFAGSNAVFDKDREYKAIFNVIPAECQMQTRAEVQLHGHILPSGAAVVPGVSLTPEAVRLLNMRDILNGEDRFSKVNMPTNRPREGKQKRAPSKSKMPRKNTPAKRQKVPQQQTVQHFQQQPADQLVGALLPSQSTNGAAFIPTSRKCTPMHLAFLESRAARASKQTTGITNTRPSIPTISSPHSQSLQPAPVVQLSSKFANRNIAAYEGPMDSKTSDICSKSMQYPRIPPQDTARLATAMNDVQLAKILQSRAKQNANESKTLPPRQTNVDSVFDSPMDKAFEQHRRQQLTGKLSVFSKAANNIQSPIKLDVVNNGKGAIIPMKISRAKRSRAKLDSPTAGDRGRQGMLPLSEGFITRTGSIAATGVAPATATHTPVVSGLPRMENKTVVIFCKRDFMRYQAVKLWRKYQEQLAKNEEWREVRVTGKRTRYLNSRYDDEIRRVHRKTFTRSSKLRREPLQEKGGHHSNKVSLVTVGSTSARRVPVDDGIDTRTSPARERGGSTASADSRDSSGDFR